MFNFSLLLGAIVLICLDFVYLNVASKWFGAQIQRVQGSPMQVRYLGVVLCYLFLIVGLNYFVLEPRRSVSDAFLLGLVIYGVYDTTNYATFKEWSWLTVVIDTLWGGTLFALTTAIVGLVRRV